MQVCLILTTDHVLVEQAKYRIEFILLVTKRFTETKPITYVARFPEYTFLDVEDGQTDDAKQRLLVAFSNLPRLYAGFNDNPAPVSRLAELPRANVSQEPVMTGRTVTVTIRQGFHGIMAFSTVVQLRDDQLATLPEIFCSVDAVHRTFIFDPATGFQDCEIMKSNAGTRIARLKEVAEAGTTLPACIFPTRGTVFDRRVRNVWRLGDYLFEDRTALCLVEIAQEKLKADVPTIRIAGMPVCQRTSKHPMPIPWMPPVTSAKILFTAKKSHVNIIVQGLHETHRFHVHMLLDRNIAPNGSAYLVPRFVNRKPRGV